MPIVPFELLRILALINGTDVAHFWYLRDKLVAPHFRSYFHCRSVEMSQYEEASRKILGWRDEGYFKEIEIDVFALTWKGRWTLHMGLQLYGEAIYMDYY